MSPYVGMIVQFTLEDGRHERPAVVTKVWGDYCVNLKVFCEPGDFGNQPDDYNLFVSSASRGYGPRTWTEMSDEGIADVQAQFITILENRCTALENRLAALESMPKSAPVPQVNAPIPPVPEVVSVPSAPSEAPAPIADSPDQAPQ